MSHGNEEQYVQACRQGNVFLQHTRVNERDRLLSWQLFTAKAWQRPALSSGKNLISGMENNFQPALQNLTPSNSVFNLWFD